VSLWQNLPVNRDRLTRERRSWNMSRIRGKDTSPELIVRSLLRRAGYRFRLNVKIPVQLRNQEKKFLTSCFHY
jgi:G:T-mismatch repair DNA endonuclease (very short patch repair protein)